MACPFCSRCFTIVSGLSHHLETSSCPNARNLSRETIHKALRERDQSGLITKKQLEWHQETWAKEGAWNGEYYECYLCHREFRQMADLNKHINSPVHQQKIYHCPNGRCGSEFVSLAGLCNHLESESCGFMRLERVQHNASNLFTGKRLLGFV